MSIRELQTELRGREIDRRWSDHGTVASQRVGRIDPDLVVAGAFALIGLLASLGLWAVLPIADGIGPAGLY